MRVVHRTSAPAGQRRLGPLRVALITEVFVPKIDGIVNTLRHVLTGFAARGVDALIVAPAGFGQAPAPFATVHAPSAPFPVYPSLRAAVLSPSVVAALDAFAPDVVHVVGPTFLGIWATEWAARRRFPLVTTYHTDLPNYLRHYGLGRISGFLWWWLRRSHNRGALTLCPSSATKAQLEAHGFRNVAVWGRGVDTRLFSPDRASASVRAELSGGHPTAPLLLYTGRLAPEKKVDLILDALPSLGAARLAVVGDGPARAALERRAAGLPVRFVGALHGEALAAAYASADAFVFASDTETFGNVVLEAMASGLPVIGAAAGGTLDLVRDGETGRLFPAGDAVALATCARSLLDDAADRARLAANARRAAISRSWADQIDRLLAYYASAAGLELRAPEPVAAAS